LEIFSSEKKTVQSDLKDFRLIDQICKAYDLESVGSFAAEPEERKSFQNRNKDKQNKTQPKIIMVFRITKYEKNSFFEFFLIFHDLVK
jgi:hypothetical protein